jgi:glutathione S-transferase
MIRLCGFGVSNYYNELKLVLREKDVPFQERLVYPWQRDTFEKSSPLGKIPFIETEAGSLSESQVILDYLEARYPERPLYPNDPFERAKCRELIQHLELNCEWVARRLYKEAIFGGKISDETKSEAQGQLAAGLEAVTQLAQFSPFIFGTEFTAADCVAYVHFTMIATVTKDIFGDDMVTRHVRGTAGFTRLMDERPHFQSMMAERAAATAAFRALDVHYEG